MTETPPQPLQVLSEDWASALAVVAHPDDLEYGAAAAIARWTGQGKRVGYCLATSGEAGIDAMPPEQARSVREQEQHESAGIVGVEQVEFLGFADGVLEYGLPLRRAIAGAIRRARPDVVVTMNHRETFGPGALNQADHVALGRAAIDAVRDAANRWVFPDVAGGQPWSGVRGVLVFGSPQATRGVDVSGTFDRGVASLRAHQAYLAGLGEATDPQEFLESIARQAGGRLGVRYGVGFEVIDLGGLSAS